MLQTLDKLRQQGRQLNYLYGRDGSRYTPGIKFAKDDMIPEEIDSTWNQEQLALAQRLRANPGARGTHPDKLHLQISDLRTRINFLQTASDVMAKDAVVILINCSAAATPKGQHRKMNQVTENLSYCYGPVHGAGRANQRAPVKQLLRQLEPAWDIRAILHGIFPAANDLGLRCRVGTPTPTSAWRKS